MIPFCYVVTGSLTPSWYFVVTSHVPKVLVVFQPFKSDLLKSYLLAHECKIIWIKTDLGDYV